MKKLNYNWQFTTTIIPSDAEVVCEDAVSADDTGIGGALVKFKSTGIYAIISAGVIKTCDQHAAQKFDALTKSGGSMTYTIFSLLCSDALDQPNLDLYIAEHGCQDDWMPQYTADQIVGILTDIHTCVRSSDFSDIVRISGLSRRAFALKHGISVRTADNWSLDTGINKRSSPEYVTRLLLFAAISDKYPPCDPE